jgi:hypothetical protein
VKPKKPPRKRHNVVIEDDLWEILEARSREMGADISWFINNAIREKYNAPKPEDRRKGEGK